MPRSHREATVHGLRREEGERTLTSGSFMGNAVLRKEDPDLLTGEARYVGDMTPPGTVHVVFVRSVMAHARIAAVDTEAARSAPGVVGVYTAADVPIAPQQLFIMLPPELTRLPLTDKARYVGDPIAAVVAESRAAAVDAAELVEVDYDPLPAVIDPFEALEPDAPVVIEAHGSNQAIVFASTADPDAMSGHDEVVTARFVNHRMSGAPIEPSAALAAPADGGAVTLWCTSQRPHEVRDVVAAALEAPPHEVRVIAPAVGGGFGSKAVVYPEFIMVTWLARHLGRPVKWVETRSENLVNMSQGRDHVHDVELGLSADGTFRWIRINVTANVGAYPAIGAFLPFFTMLMASGPYRIPAVHYEAVAAITNTTPVAAFRGAGRPEATVTLERIVDLAAGKLGIDPAELRRRNLLAPTDFPLTTPTGANMDCGEYARALGLALETAGYDELRAEQARRRAGGSRKLLGIGVSSYVEITAVGLFNEFGSVTVDLDGTITARVGTASHGQGHATAFSQILGEVLGVPAEQVRVIHSDTGEVPRGTGTVASRSLQIGGSAVFTAANEVLETARRLAASLLEADRDDIVVAPGGLAVAGVPARTVSWADLAAAAASDDLPAGVEPGGLAAETDFNQGESSYPFGAHVSVVEIDADTGDTRVLRHVAVDDCGRILNPLLVQGQVHGGVATGISQALYEETTYDSDGNPRNTNFADYAIPAASELPRFEMAHTETPTPLNPLGAKGIGESGTIGSIPAVQSAVLDALAPLGIDHLDMPFTPQRVWRAIAAAS
ncbi:MAG: xanthine dehydrogenase family protein molybdopterin-binding subunit [Acidimicrobiaceae bacterium]|nr:xanthine dehydrogenase family protein molybdopterin-binding subunit [Acidimicrobiaceae bacterium]MYK77648.1 xanthine dehydrogenase family protein molybdopterin-binding subunit [Acidimicrobiaceae bacterium]